MCVTVAAGALLVLSSRLSGGDIDGDIDGDSDGYYPGGGGAGYYGGGDYSALADGGLKPGAQYRTLQHPGYNVYRSSAESEFPPPYHEGLQTGPYYQAAVGTTVTHTNISPLVRPSAPPTNIY